MPYTGNYSLATRCLTEFVATFFAIGFGEGIIANAELPSTKGHGMGFAWISFGFGMAFTFAIMMFGFASAHLNPAMVLSLWIRNELSAGEFFALAASQMAGGFCAAIFVYLVYLPHFSTVPEPSGSQEDHLLRTRDYIDPSALRFASYSTRKVVASPAGRVSSQRKTFSQRLGEAKYYLLAQNFDDAPETVIEHLIGGTFALHGAEVPFPTGIETVNDAADAETQPVQLGALKRRHSLQVADMQRLLRKMEKELSTSENVGAPLNHTSTYGIDSATPQRASVLDLAAPAAALRRSPAFLTDIHEIRASDTTVGVAPANSNTDNKVVFQNSVQSMSNMSVTAKLPKEEALDRAAIAADQATKLSVFATRPAIFLPIHNFFVEMIGTAVLIFGASLIDSRMSMITNTPELQALGIALKPFLVGVFIMVLVLALGGPTGFAANPARDMAPRLAHLLLPIPGKGTSELWYGLVVNIGMLAGGALGGVLVIAVDQIRTWTI
ncbi:aquaporin-like protein [Chytriomyces sp. MP71]|nr:aquaporin-like protein [Chytriomyces sp. MP71]